MSDEPTRRVAHTAIAIACLAAVGRAQPEVDAIPTVRVLVVENAETLELRCRGRVQLEIPGRAKPVHRWSDGPTLEVERAKGVFRIQRLKLEQPSIAFVAEDRTVEIAGRRYPQRVELVAAEKGDGFRVVNEVDIETYVASVTRSEIGAGSDVEALKAQAIAARSYVAAGLDGFPKPRRRPPVFDVHDDTRSQVYKGVHDKDPKLERAVEETAAQVLTYRNRIVRAFFSASCGGATRGVAEWNGGREIPPLAGVTCGFCDAVGRGKWETRITLAELGAALEAETGGAKVRDARIASTTRSGRPAVVELVCGRRRVEVPSERFREALGIETTWFTVEVDGEGVALAGVGHGHGVGLCQIGAREMARAGWDAARILGHYYPEAELEVAYRVRERRR